MPVQIKDAKELSKTLGNAFSVFTLLNDYIECYYNAEIKWGKRGIHGLFSLTYRQAGKSLCTIYVNEGYITVLFVFGKHDQEAIESSAYHVAKGIQDIYDNTHIYPEGKWIWLNIYSAEFFDDIKHFLSIKRKPDEKAMAMCGNKCDKCKAYVKNIRKNDQREQLSAVWEKAFEVSVSKESIGCDGCRCAKKDAKLADTDCPVRKCVIERQLNHCGDCPNFPCETFGKRDSFSFINARKAEGIVFDADELDEFLSAYDNKTRLNKYIDCQLKKPVGENVE